MPNLRSPENNGLRKVSRAFSDTPAHGFTVWFNDAELPVNCVVPLYVACTVAVPTGRELVETLALLLLKETEPRLVVPAVKVTVPVAGTPVEEVTTAVNLTV